MESRTKTVLGGVSVVSFLLAALTFAALLDATRPMIGAAAPTLVCILEIKVAALAFFVSVLMMEPAKGMLVRRPSSAANAMRRSVRLPGPALVAAVVLVSLGLFVFAFWSIADVLGGYNGYGYAFAHYPTLGRVYAEFVARIPYVGSLDKGAQASIFFGLACLGVFMIRSEKGKWTALNDVLTLFAAPILVVFELALWYSAPQDMSWHVTDYLWLGGVADGGWRMLDVGGAYLFSNWLVLSIALFAVAYRIPWISLPSRVIWRKKRQLARLTHVITVRRGSDGAQ